MIKLDKFIEFMCGAASYDDNGDVWFSDNHPDKKGKFWWRKELREHIASLEAQLQEREFRVSVSEMTESHQVTYWVCLERGDRPLDAKPWDKGMITPFKTKIADNAYTDACEWAEFLGADLPSPPITKDSNHG